MDRVSGTAVVWGAERHGRQRVAEGVNQVGEERNAVGRDEHAHLSCWDLRGFWLSSTSLAGTRQRVFAR